jgi:hypothetical protein
MKPSPALAAITTPTESSGCGPPEGVDRLFLRQIEPLHLLRRLAGRRLEDEKAAGLAGMAGHDAEVLAGDGETHDEISCCVVSAPLQSRGGPRGRGRISAPEAVPAGSVTSVAVAAVGRLGRRRPGCRSPRRGAAGACRGHVHATSPSWSDVLSTKRVIGTGVDGAYRIRPRLLEPDARAVAGSVQPAPNIDWRL